LSCQNCPTHSGGFRQSFFRRFRQLFQRFDTIQTARLYDETVSPVLTAGTGGLFGKMKKLHDPIVYFVLGILAGFRYDWCFKSPVYWFAIGFTIKWYRARYVFKIPVWDRQPNWNNIITSKEQEKDLKAFTCKNCGSTIFIAKTREFFFEGSTGFGGLGCFSCGAKGKDNFVMDRDRIVEDVGDMDDYFEYERPLDFVSRAERRKLLKEAQGDEDRANQLLLERTTGITSATSPNDSVVESVDFVQVETEEVLASSDVIDNAPISSIYSESSDGDTSDYQLKANITSSDDDFIPENSIAVDDLVMSKEEPELVADKTPDYSSKDKNTRSEQAAAEPVVEVSKRQDMNTTPKKAISKPKSSGSTGLDGLDELDMDAW
jgi:hypothetical protein